MILKTVWAVRLPYNVLSLHAFVSAVPPSMDIVLLHVFNQDLGLPKFENEVKVDDKVFA